MSGRPSEEDREFQEWLKKRQPREEGDVPASVTFMEMMRQAAARQTPDAPTPAATQAPPAEAASRAATVGQHDPVLDSVVVPRRPPKPTPVRPQADDAPLPKLRPERRPRPKREHRTLGMFAGIFRSLVIVAAAAGLTATIFTWFTPPTFISSNVRDTLSLAVAASQATPTPVAVLPGSTPNWARLIGIVSGHRGPQNDPGAVCPDGLTEASINFNVAQLVVNNLNARGYSVDLLDEFDPRLDDYQAAALVSIHANTCQNYGELVSGFLISAAAARVSARGNDNILVECVANTYGVASGLERRMGVTIDMTDYHTFREIHPNTPAAIIELGFLLADREVMTERPDALANGITDGILCFLEPGNRPPVIPSTPASST